MREKTRGKIIQRRSQNLIFRLLTFWGEYRRIILLVLIAAALFGFLASLAPGSRRLLGASLLAQRTVLILLLAFTLITLSLLFSAGQRLDTWVFMLFNLRGYHPLWLDRVMWAATQIGNGIFGILLGVILYFVGYQRMAIELLLGILTLWMAIELIKAVVERSRPFLTLEGTRVVGWKERGLSFPSGHTSQAFFMMTVLNQYFEFGALFTGLLYGLAVLVGFTRIYVGAHYPRDVIAGAVLGSVWGLMSELIEIYFAAGQF
jgi:membrane-associated phospholipid phosphatase